MIISSLYEENYKTQQRDSELSGLDWRPQYLSIMTLGLKVGTNTSVSDTSSVYTGWTVRHHVDIM